MEKDQFASRQIDDAAAQLDSHGADIATQSDIARDGSRFGNCRDALDELVIYDDFDAESWEAVMLQIYADAKTDSALAAALKLYHAQEDSEEAFAGYAASSQPRAISELLPRLGIQKHHAVCDLGCGKGRLAFALHQLGYVNVSAMDPNDQWHSGTGFLNSIAGSDIKIINKLSEWHNIFNRFDAIISMSTMPIPTKAPVCNGIMPPGDSGIMAPPFYEMIPPGRRVR